LKSFDNFFKKQVISSFTPTNNNIFRHSDFDDETRLIRRNFGKPTPIALLKCPTTDLFFIRRDNNELVKPVQLVRFRFNKVKSTGAGKPIRNTVYLTFKQKRYNQRVNIASKTAQFLDKNCNSTKTYSGNPFLVNNTILNENFGNPTSQYRMFKKSKNRVENNKLST